MSSRQKTQPNAPSSTGRGFVTSAWRMSTPAAAALRTFSSLRSRPVYATPAGRRDASPPHFAPTSRTRSPRRSAAAAIALSKRSSASGSLAGSSAARCS